MGGEQTLVERGRTMPAQARAGRGQTAPAARRAAAAPRVAQLCCMEQTANRAPGVRRLEHAGAALQRRPVAQLMSIDGQRVPPTGKRGKELFAKLRLGMFTAGLSPHGSGNVFKQLAARDDNYASDEAFVSHFVGLARLEAARVQQARQQGKKGKQAKGWTRALKIGRPGWPEAYKKAVKKGQDIRHIVRNATLKNALEAECDFQLQKGEPQALLVMNELAKTIGLPGDSEHSHEALVEIYKAAYLNLGNLFGGAGAINRVIGLTADEITKLGLKLMASTDFATPESIAEQFEHVAYLVSEVSDRMEHQAEKMDPEQAQTFLQGFEEFYNSLTDYLIDREDELQKAAARTPESAQEEVDEDSMLDELPVGVTEAEIGREFVDIGANFGFDIPDQALESQQMQSLVFTEIALASYQPGNPGELAKVLRQFMQVKHVLEV
jgi:hypothetical protein